MNSIEAKEIVSAYVKADNKIACFQLANTFVLYVVFWAMAVWSPNWVLTVAATLGISAMTLRIFVLMHDCGHGSMFEKTYQNRIVGFFLGVLCGTPQVVWSSRHAYHHSTNGNWEKYGGPLGTIPVEKYESFSTWNKYVFQILRHWSLAPLGGFIYIVLNPRIIWTLECSRVVRENLSAFLTGEKLAYKIRYWKTQRGFWHMTGTNILFVALCYGISRYLGATPFLWIFLISLSIAGTVGLVFFTAQHNFENSYASGDEGWDYFDAAIEGTSFLKLPAVLNWITANIGYHHVHHLSSKIPNYRLVQCHNEHAEKFRAVRRLSIFDLPSCLRALVWDKRLRKVYPMPPLPGLKALKPLSA